MRARISFYSVTRIQRISVFASGTEHEQRHAVTVLLVDGKVTIKGSDGSTEEFNVSGGFLSVANNRVSVLGESATQ